MSVLLLFIDGIGIGGDDPETNPFAAERVRRLSPLFGEVPEDGCEFRPLDATLGIPGLPQSATGQTTLFTGINAARLAGRHMQGLPGPALRAVLERNSLFHMLKRQGRRPTFANAYTRKHLESKRKRWSATTRMALSSGTVLRVLDGGGSLDDLVFHDYTGEWPVHHGIAMPRRSASEAAAILVRFLDDHDLVLYEYFLTDLAGHRGSPEEKRLHARRAEELVDAAVRLVALERHTVVVVSDHGNLEDSSTRLHTLNPVPILAWGAASSEIVSGTSSMMHLAPALIATFKT